MKWVTTRLSEDAAYYLHDIAAKTGEKQWRVLERVLREASEATPSPVGLRASTPVPIGFDPLPVSGFDAVPHEEGEGR